MECTVREINRFLTKKIKYPNKARRNKITGTVYIAFVVDQSGKIEDVRLLKTSASPLLDEAALKVINKMPDWIPGMQKGKNVRVQFTVPVSFRLPG